MHSNIKLCIETSNVDQITIFLDAILGMENYINTHYLFCLYMRERERERGENQLKCLKRMVLMVH